ncbi:MAG: 50S ribosomal protein L1 [Candidatus Nanohaloarchaeota archaeon QJJ-7]|nr:50S ribosomal protein L1 [Candidatus Nanohaloarchaeota archaeon QJJ-7]
MSFDDAVEQLREDAEDRNFTQAVDLVINLRDLDLDDPDNRFSTEITLPHSRSEETKVCVIGETITTAADNADRTIDPDELDEIMEDEATAKDLAEEYDFFIAEAPLMPKIGRELGSVFGPRDKMPEPMEPGEDPTERIEGLRNTISISLRESPSIKCKVGDEEMEDSEIEDNAEAVYNAVTNNLPRNDHNVKDALLKLTMSSPVEVDT